MEISIFIIYYSPLHAFILLKCEQDLPKHSVDLSPWTSQLFCNIVLETASLHDLHSWIIIDLQLNITLH